MRTLIHLLLLALTLTASTSTYARAFEANPHQATGLSASKLASGGFAFERGDLVGASSLQGLESHQENGLSEDATTSAFVVLVHNTCGFFADNNALVALSQGSYGARAFFARNAGRISISPTVEREFLRVGSRTNLEFLKQSYGISVIADAGPGAVLHAYARLGLSGVLRNDVTILATAGKSGLRLVSGDANMVRRAVSLGTDVLARRFPSAGRAGFYSGLRESLGPAAPRVIGW